MEIPDRIPGNVYVATAIRGVRDQITDALDQPEDVLRERMAELASYFDEVAAAVDRITIETRPGSISPW